MMKDFKWKPPHYVDPRLLARRETPSDTLKRAEFLRLLQKSPTANVTKAIDGWHPIWTN